MQGWQCGEEPSAGLNLEKADKPNESGKQLYGNCFTTHLINYYKLKQRVVAFTGPPAPADP
jgi:hypothetical protein